MPILLLFAAVISYLGTGEAIPALLAFAFVSLSGVTLYLLLRLNFSFFYCVFYTSIVLLVSLFLVCCVPDMLAGKAPYATLVGWFESSAVLTGLYTAEEASYLGAILEQIYVACLYVIAAGFSLVNFIALQLINRLAKKRLVRKPAPFFLWAAPRSFLAGIAALAGVALVLSVTGSQYSLQMWVTVIVMWTLPMAAGGLPIFVAFSGFRRGIFIFLCIGLLLFFPYSLITLAMFGTWRTVFVKAVRPPKK